MTRLGRRLAILAAIVVVVGSLGGILFRKQTLEALRRAESFEFRRMLVTRRGEDGADRFFFVTNRAIEAPDAAPESRFGSRRGPALSYGLFDTSIEPSLGLGMLINPSDWFSEQIQVRDVRDLEREDFVRELREQVLASPRRSLLVTIHGFRERFPSALRKTAFVAHVLDVDSPQLVFDWPGDQGSGLRGYRRAQAAARASGRELAETLEVVLREVRPERLWIVANSMGAEVVVNAFAALAVLPDLADAETEIEDAVLTAPDVSYEAFGREFRDEITALVRNLTVYVSSNDRALLMSRLVNRRRRLGESSVDLARPDQSEEALATLELVEPGSEAVTLVDVTPVNRTRNFHNFSLETPEFFDDLFMRLTNETTPRSRRAYRVITPEGKAYWVLTRGR